MVQSQLKKKKPMCNFWYNFIKAVGGIPALIWMRAKPLCLMEDGTFKGSGKMPRFKNAMLCANHNSYTDPILIQCVFWYKSVNSLATSEFFATPFLRFLFKSMKCIPVDKANFGMSSFHAVCERLEAGEPVLIFPEGGLNQDSKNELKALKSGVVLMAHRTDSPIIPMYIVPIKKWYQRRTVLIGQPIHTRQITGDRPSMGKIEEITVLLQDRETELKMRYEAEYKKRG